MKSIFVVGFLAGLLVSILVWTCNNTAGPDNGRGLVIESGYYSEIAGRDSSELKCAVELVYYVRIEKCQIGGYGIKFDSTHSGQLDMYMMQTLIPGQKYTRADTFRLGQPLISAPVVSMQAYRIGSSVVDDNLRDECVLTRKTQADD